MRRNSALAGLLAVVASVGLTLAAVVGLAGGGVPVSSGAPAVAGPPSPAGPSGGIAAPASPPPVGPEAASPEAPSLFPTAPSPIPPATASPTRPAVPLPALIGAIGDSLTAGVNATGALGAQPEHSWVVGTAADDPVESHLERLRVLGADPAVAAAYQPGAPITSAVAQAAEVTAAAAELPRGSTAYVTFELGANDVCAPSLASATDPETFAAAAAAAFRQLAAGLPPGSHLVVLSVPDVTRIRELVERVPAAVDLHRRYGVCTSVLGAGADPLAVRDRIEAYNTILVRLCEELNGPPLGCRHDLAGDPSRSLFGAEFDLPDLSPLDFFHPSVLGQARIAEESWALTPWAG